MNKQETKHKIAILVTGLIFTTVFASCFNFKGIGEDLGEGLQNRADSLGKHLVLGAMDGFTNEESQKKLRNKLDSLLIILGQSTNSQVVGLRDSLLGEYTRRWLNEIKDDIIGEVTRKQLGSLRDEILGDKTIVHLMNMRNELIGYNTRELIRLIVSDLRNEALNDTTTQRLATIRGVLLGPETRSAVNTLVDSAMITIVNRYRSDMKPELEDWGFLQRNVKEILIVIGIIVLIIIAYVWYQKQKYLKMTKMLTYQISEVKEPSVRNDLENNISKNAKLIGIEDELRKLLEKQGILT